MKSKQTHPATIRIKPDVWANLRSLAESQGTNRNRLVAEMLEAGVSEALLKSKAAA
jgi:predicted HicB family RNase H-like nuclease